VKKLMFVVVAALLLGAAPAQAKELLGAELCGPDGCATQRAAGLLEGPNGPFSGELASSAKPGPWYRGYLLAGDRGKVVGKLPFYYVPGDGGGQIVQPGRYGQVTVWTRAQGKVASLVAALAARIEPYGTPQMTSVTVNGRAVRDPQSYLRLWTLGKKATGYPDGLDSGQVVFYSDPASPWSDGNYVVAYAKSNLLLRDGKIVALPKDVAERIAARASLAPDDGFPWTLTAIVAVAALAVAVIVLAVLLPRRLRPRPSPRPVAQA
jgi:hypothetical protein